MTQFNGRKLNTHERDFKRMTKRKKEVEPEIDPPLTYAQFIDSLSLRASGYVKRWHTFPTNSEQTIAEHSAQALSLLFMLHPDPEPNLIKALLWHDHAERHAGDVPAPVLRADPEFAESYARAEEKFFRDHEKVWEAMSGLTMDEKLWLKSIDRLELVLWCHDQAMLGNKHAMRVARRGMNYIRERGAPQQILDFLHFLEEEGVRSFA